jgi:hypothetical protein
MHGERIVAPGPETRGAPGGRKGLAERARKSLVASASSLASAASGREALQQLRRRTGKAAPRELVAARARVSLSSFASAGDLPAACELECELGPGAADEPFSEGHELCVAAGAGRRFGTQRSRESNASGAASGPSPSPSPTLPRPSPSPSPSSSPSLSSSRSVGSTAARAARRSDLGPTRGSAPSSGSGDGGGKYWFGTGASKAGASRATSELHGSELKSSRRRASVSSRVSSALSSVSWRLSRALLARRGDADDDADAPEPLLDCKQWKVRTPLFPFLATHFGTFIERELTFDGRRVVLAGGLEGDTTCSISIVQVHSASELILLTAGFANYALAQQGSTARRKRTCGAELVLRVARAKADRDASGRLVAPQWASDLIESVVRYRLAERQRQPVAHGDAMMGKFLYASAHDTGRRRVEAALVTETLDSERDGVWAQELDDVNGKLEFAFLIGLTAAEASFCARNSAELLIECKQRKQGAAAFLTDPDRASAVG